MKKILTTIAVFTITASMAIAQSADEIIAKHIEARGGAEKIKAIQSIVMEGSMNQGGVDVVMKFTQVNNKATRVDFNAMGQSGYNIITTTEGWSFNPFMGQTAAEAMTPEQLKESQYGLDIQGPLFDYKTKGSTLEYQGKESINGNDYYKLKLTRAGNKVTTYYLDKNYLVFRVSSMVSTPQGETESVTEFGDYKKTAEGFLLPYKRTMGQVEISFDKIEVNPKIDDAVFKPAN